MASNPPSVPPTPESSGQHSRGNYDCHHYLASLSEYIDGNLQEDLCRELEAHMAECENCRIVVNTLAKTVTLYHRLPEPEMPQAVRERLFRTLQLDSIFSARDDTAG